MLTMETHTPLLSVRLGKNEYKRMFMGNSGQVTAIVEQIDDSAVNVYHYRRTFKPQALIPDVDYRGDAVEAVKAITPDVED